MATADLITSFLSNEMSPEQERAFLLTVASSDSLRLELKSHVMLDRIFVAQSQRVDVPEAVRGMIFAQAGVSVAGPRADDAPRVTSSAGNGGFFSGTFLSRFVKGGMILLVASTGFAAGYFSSATDRDVAQPAVTTAPAPGSVSVPSPAADNSGVSSQPATTADVDRVESPRNDVAATPRTTTADRTRREATRPTVNSNTRVSTPADVGTNAPSGSVSDPNSVSATPRQPTVVEPPAASVDINTRKSSEPPPVGDTKKEEESRMP